MAFVRKVVEAEGGDEHLGRLMGDGLDDQYPALSEYLSEHHFDDGSLRITSTALLFQEEGVWKVCLNDRQNDRSMWAAGSTVSAAFDALEVLVATGTGVWRKSGQSGKYKGKK